jgi:hypothetical protein
MPLVFPQNKHAALTLIVTTGATPGSTTSCPGAYPAKELFRAGTSHRPTTSYAQGAMPYYFLVRISQREQELSTSIM